MDLGKILKKIKNNKCLNAKKDISIKKFSKEKKIDLNKKIIGEKDNNIKMTKEKQINKKIDNNYKKCNKIKINNMPKDKNKEINKNSCIKISGKTDSNYSIDNLLESNILNNKTNINEDNKDSTISKNISNLSIYNEENITIHNDDVTIINEKELQEKENYKIINDLFEEQNLDNLPDDYDENFNDLYSIVNKINFGRVLVGVEGFFTCEGKSYKEYKEKFNKLYDKFLIKKRNSISNSNNKQKNLLEIVAISSNAKTNYYSSKKGIVNNNIDIIYNDLNKVNKNLN